MRRGVAQLASAYAWVREAGGSSPLTPTIQNFQMFVPKVHF
jgi:hypothetical protein